MHVHVIQGEGYPRKELVDVFVRVPHRQQRHNDVIEYIEEDKECTERNHVPALALLGGVVELEV